MEKERIHYESPSRANGQALGSVARDVLDHATTIVRDEIKIARLEARRYGEHLRRDVARPAALGAAAVSLGALGALFGLIALFLGIARAIDSVAWTFAIYAGAFCVAGVVAYAMAKRPQHRDVGEEIARRFPATRTKESEREHLLVAQRTRPEAHREEVAEARREARPWS